MTWLYWQLSARHSGVLQFSRVMVDGTQRSVQHPYIDPTGAKPSEMLMVWAHTDAERAAQIIGGVYTLEAQQLHDLQDWCACLLLGPSRTRTHARRHGFRQQLSGQLSTHGHRK